MATHDFFFPSLSLTSETWPLFRLLFCLKAHVMFDFCCQTAFCWLTAFSWAEKNHHHRIISPRCCRNRCHVLSQVFTLKPKYSTRYNFNFMYKSLKPHTVDLFLFFFFFQSQLTVSGQQNVFLTSWLYLQLKHASDFPEAWFDLGLTYNLNKGPSAVFFFCVCVEYLSKYKFAWRKMSAFAEFLWTELTIANNALITTSGDSK